MMIAACELPLRYTSGVRGSNRSSKAKTVAIVVDEAAVCRFW
jgi:hypothetical protein